MIGRNGRNGGEPPPLRLEPRLCLCGRHAEVLAPQFPRGYAVAIPRLLELALTVPALIRSCGGDIGRLGAVLAELPICGWLPDRLVEEVLREAVESAPPAASGDPIVGIRVDPDGRVVVVPTE